MSIVLGLLGLTILLVALVDVVTTTLSLKGAGVVSGRLASAIWSAALALHRRWPSHERLAYVGPVILLAVISLWTVMMWLGWTLFFLLSPGAVVGASYGAPADVLETAYFVGYTIITLGNGEYRPVGVFWQLMTLLASATGFFVVTLAITFLLSVLPAVVSKRQTALYIAGLGLEPQEILARHWQGGDCTALVDHLPTLTDGVASLAQKLLAYPVLHYFHSADPRSAFALRIAALDEALRQLRSGLACCRETSERVTGLRDTIGALLDSLDAQFLATPAETPPPAPLEPLAERGLEIVDEQAYLDEVANDADRRERLLGFVRHDGWEWRDLYESSG